MQQFHHCSTAGLQSELHSDYRQTFVSPLCTLGGHICTSDGHKSTSDGQILVLEPPFQREFRSLPEWYQMVSRKKPFWAYAFRLDGRRLDQTGKVMRHPHRQLL